MRAPASGRPPSRRPDRLLSAPRGSVRSSRLDFYTAIEDAGRRVSSAKISHWLAPLADSTVLVASVVYGALMTLAVRAGLLGLWLLVLVLPSLWRYAYVVLRAAAQGKAHPPPAGLDSMNPIGDWRAIAHLAVFAGAAVLIRRLGADPGVADAAAALAGALIFPASAVILALTGSLAAALSPIGIASIVRVMGRDYLLLAALGIGVAAVAQLTQRLIVPRLGALAGAAGWSVAAWALLAEFALIGASIRAHGDDFEIPGAPSSAAETDARARRRAWQAELDLAYAAIRSGEVERGYRTLRRLIADNGGSAEVHYWLFENMIDWEDRAHAFRVARRLVARLVEIGDLHAALELVQRCRRLGTELTIGAGAARLLARYAREIGRPGIASELDAQSGGAGSD